MESAVPSHPGGLAYVVGISLARLLLGEKGDLNEKEEHSNQSQP